nr:uncharacterized protein LOC105328568 [Crassostrea gigas]
MYQGEIEFESDECLKYKDSKKKTKKRRRVLVPANKTAADVEDADAILKKSKKEALKKNSSESAKETSDGQSNHYLPKRGICVDKCYVVAENPENFTIPRGYVKFVEGHDIYIEAKWLSNVKSLFRGKTKPHCLKLIMNGLYEPNEIQKKTAMILLQTPLSQALKVTTLGMDSTDIVKAINTKIGTSMCHAIKENRLSK